MKNEENIQKEITRWITVRTACFEQIQAMNYIILLLIKQEQKKRGRGATASLEQRSSVLCSYAYACVCVCLWQFVTQPFVRFTGQNKALCDRVCRCSLLHSLQDVASPPGQ